MERLFLNPAEAAGEVISQAKEKTALPLDKMFILGVMAGLYVAFGAALYTMIAHDSRLAATLGSATASLFGAIVFTTGIILVFTTGASLFSADCLFFTAVLDGAVTVGEIVTSWLTVYLGNLVGSLMAAGIVAGTGLWSANGGIAGVNAIAIAASKCSLTFAEAFWRGVGCNLLLCLAFQLALCARSVAGKVQAAFLPLLMFAGLGFEHCVSNMYFIPAGIFARGFGVCLKAGKFQADTLAVLNWKSFVVANLIPVTIGNIVGGAVLLATVCWFVYVKENNA